MKYLLTVMLLLLPVSAGAHEKNHDCEKHPIYCQIVTNNPTIKRAYAFRLSNIIHNNVRRYKLPPKIFTAILAQESMYKLSARNCTTGITAEPQDQRVMRMCLNAGEFGSAMFVSCMKENLQYMDSKVKVCTDFGIGQIWYKTAESYDFNLERLTTDLAYSVEAAAIVLKDFKNRYHKKDPDWWTRYNASSTHARKKYKGLVERFIEVY